MWIVSALCRLVRVYGMRWKTVAVCMEALVTFLCTRNHAHAFAANLIYIQGHSSDRLAAKFNVSRKDQDEFTVMSHTRAAAAHAAGFYKVTALWCCVL